MSSKAVQSRGQMPMISIQSVRSVLVTDMTHGEIVYLIRQLNWNGVRVRTGSNMRHEVTEIGHRVANATTIKITSVYCPVCNKNLLFVEIAMDQRRSGCRWHLSQNVLANAVGQRMHGRIDMSQIVCNGVDAIC